MARLVPSGVALRTEVNVVWPGRDKTSDGWIGDPAHAARVSDHNPDDRGVVHAIDIDKDGINVQALLRAVIGDRRVKYVIWSGRIWSRSWGWTARKYTGVNQHTAHVHVSFRSETVYALDATPYGVGKVTTTPVRPISDGGPEGPFPYPDHHLIGRDGRGRVTVHDGSAVYQGRHEKHTVYPVQREVGATPDGRYGPDTEKRVRAWQAHARATGTTTVPITGSVDPQTWAAMVRR